MGLGGIDNMSESGPEGHMAKTHIFHTFEELVRISGPTTTKRSYRVGEYTSAVIFLHRMRFTDQN